MDNLEEGKSAGGENDEEENGLKARGEKMDKMETIDSSQRAVVVNCNEAEAVELEESSLEAVVTSFLKRAAKDGIEGRLAYLTNIHSEGGCSFQLPINSADYLSRRLWGDIREETYREVFLWMVRSFVIGNKKLVKKMLKHEFKTRWD